MKQNKQEQIKSNWDRLEELASDISMPEALDILISQTRQEAVEEVLEKIENEFESIGYLPEQGECYQSFTESRWKQIKSLSLKD